MGEQQPSFMKNIKAKFGHHSRSVSQPPMDRTFERAAVPVDYRPSEQLDTRVNKLGWPIMRADLPARHHPNPLRQEIKRASSPSVPLLQLPRHRAMWRRSLEDLSPTKKSEWWTDPDLEALRMTFNIACALPPQYLEHLPAYSDEDEKAELDRKEWAALHNLHTGHSIPFFYEGRDVIPTPRTGLYNEERSPRRGSSPIQSSYCYYPRGRDDVSIDSLLSHPMLCMHTPYQTQDSHD